MKNTTTNNTHAARLAAARARHAVTLPEVITLPDTLPPVTDSDRAAYLYPVAHAAVAVCLRAREHSGGQRLITDLRRMWGQDHSWQAAADMSATADLYRLTHDQQREQAAAAQAEADRLTREAAKLTTSTTDRDRLTAAAAAQAKAARDLKRKAADNLAAAQDIESRLAELTASDRENIVHDAIVAALTASPSAADENDMFRAVCSGAGRALDALRAARAGGYRTKVQHMGDRYSAGHITHKATAAENAAAYQAWTAAHPNADKVPFSVRGGLASGYYTAEWRDSKQHPAAYYLISHYTTETPAELADALNLAKPQPVELYDVQHLAKAADLTKRERAALLLLTLATGTAKPKTSDPAKAERLKAAARCVVRAGVAAVQQHDTDTAAAVAMLDTQDKRSRKQRDRDKQRESVRAAAMLDKALTLAGVPETALKMARSRFRARLAAAMEQQRSSTSTTSAAPAQLDALDMWSKAAAAAPANRHPFPGHIATVGASVLAWSDRYDPSTAHTLTAAQQEQETAASTAAAAASRAAHAADTAAADLRRACLNHSPSRTAYAAHDAQAAAAVFLLHMTPDELHTVGRALLDERAEDEQRKAAALARLNSSGIYGLNTTLDMWRSWTAEERAAHMEYLNGLSK